MQEARLDLGMSDRYLCRYRGSLEGVGFNIQVCVHEAMVPSARGKGGDSLAGGDCFPRSCEMTSILVTLPLL